VKRLLVPLFFLLACGGGEPAAECTSSSDCTPGDTCLDGECRARATRDGGGVDAFVSGVDSGPRRELVSLAIDPPSATLEVPLGTHPTQTFTVVGSYSDGTMGPVVAPELSVDDVSTGDIDPASGVFTANGAIGGVVTVTAIVPGTEASAEATLTVTLAHELVGDGVPDDAASRFEAPVDDDTRQADVVYPLDGALMPQNVYPADVQWLRGVDGDLYRITLRKPHAEVVAYVMPTGNHWLVDAPSWSALAQTDPDDPMEIHVDRWEAATSTAIRSPMVSIQFAGAALTGSVYYWDIQRGRIVRIDDGTADAVEFMPNPPGATNPSERCVGCHSVSNSGRYMAGRLGGGENIGAVFDLTTDLTGDPPPVVPSFAPSLGRRAGGSRAGHRTTRAWCSPPTRGARARCSSSTRSPGPSSRSRGRRPRASHTPRGHRTGRRSPT